MSIYKTIAIWACVPFFTQAQFLDYGTDPARFKWNQVSLPHYTLIYPQGTDSAARRYALYLENVYPHLAKTMKNPVGMKFPVILHPANMASNGMVAWSPRRMELFTTPSSTLQSEPWDRHLVIHESRHVVQTGKLMTGIFQPLYFLMGEQAAGISSAFVPRWFFEGDAVSMETALSETGRGRLPEFQMTYRAQMLAAPFYSFDKWYLGSYKDYTGDFYALGYDMTAFARYTYGADIWDKTVSRYVKHPIAFPPFANAFRHHTGSTFGRLFKETFAFLAEEWVAQDSGGYLVPRYLSPETKQYTSYKYPQARNDSTVIAVKSSLADLPSLVSLAHGREKRLTYTGNISGKIILRGDRVYWMEQIPSLRWTHENHTVIKYAHLSTRGTETLTARSRYISFAAGDSFLVASLFTEEGVCRIARIDAESGKEEQQYDTPGDVFVKELALGGPDTLYAVAVDNEGIRLLQLHLQTSRWEELLGPTWANIASPAYRDGKLFFESGLDGTNNLYYLDTSTRKAYRVSRARFGAFQPAYHNGREEILFADYQSKGYRIAALPVDSLIPQEADFGRPAGFALADTLAQQEDFRLNSSPLTPVEFSPRPYRKAAHLFRVHSWAPLYYNVSELVNGGATDFITALKPGATLISQNSLNTAITQAGWYYSKGYHHGKLDFMYMGWWPVLHLNIDYGDKAFDILWVKNEEGAMQAVSRPTRRNLLKLQAQAYLPLNLTKDRYVHGIQPSLTYYYTNNAYQQYGSRLMTYFQYLLAEIRWYNYRKPAHRDILPRLGYQLRLQYLNLPFHTANFGDMYVARLTTYWPGVLPHHSLMLRAGYAYQSNDDRHLYIPKQLIEAPRGYDYLYRTHQQIALKADYAFPIAMPDFSLGSLAYIRRVRTNLFYDLNLNQADSPGEWTTQSSVGGDILFDWNALRFSFPLVTGLRLIRTLESGTTRPEVLFSISF
ncbi:MAG: hypothetical protein LBB84_12405 [Tannerellaceae bacterium]|jgi:hypothetical protein|nr:hypothetical protein [Tannerellaceae bacterium]